MKIFFSTPIAGFDSEQQYEIYRKKLLNLYNKVKNHFGEENIFAAFFQTQTFDDYDSPVDSAKIDIAAIDNCDLFCFFYPQKAATSALVELGYAFAKNKQILITSPNIEILPYMVQGLPTAYSDQITWMTDANLDAIAAWIFNKI